MRKQLLLELAAAFLALGLALWVTCSLDTRNERIATLKADVRYWRKVAMDNNEKLNRCNASKAALILGKVTE